MEAEYEEIAAGFLLAWFLLWAVVWNVVGLTANRPKNHYISVRARARKRMKRAVLQWPGAQGIHTPPPARLRTPRPRLRYKHLHRPHPMPRPMPQTGDQIVGAGRATATWPPVP